MTNGLDINTFTYERCAKWIMEHRRYVENRLTHTTLNAAECEEIAESIAFCAALTQRIDVLKHTA